MKKSFWFAAALALVLAPFAQADFDQAMDDFKRGKYVEAAAGFQEIVDNAASYDFGYFMLGMSFLQMDKPDDAVENFRKAIEINGDRFDYHYNMATAFFKGRRYADAIATLRTAEGLAQDDKGKFALYSLRGQSYVGLEKWSDAIADLEKAREITSTPAVLEQLGFSYYMLGHFDKAVPVLRSALKSSPNDESLLSRTAKALLNLGAETRDESKKLTYYRESLQFAEQALKLVPNDFDTNNLVGRAALGAKSYDRAEQAFRKVLAQRSDYCYAMANLGKVYIATEKWREAESILREGAKCAPRMAVVYESLGFSLQKQRRLEEAIEQYNKAMEIKPSPSIRTMIETCRKNIEIDRANQEMDAEERANQEAIEEERRRIEEEEAKQKEWEERRKRDD